MENRKFGVAIIGYGGMGSWHGEKLLTLTDELILTGTYDILPERREASEQAGIHAYSSMKELLEDPAVDLVTIATPNDIHRDLAIEAMRAGKAVVCEKPVTLNLQELDDILAVSKETGKLFTVHQNRRWDEDYLVIKKIFEENRLGKVFNIESRVHGSRGIPGDWRNTKEHGGGMILDWGVHLFDQLLMMIPHPVTSVYAELTYVTNDVVDDGFRVLLQFGKDLRCLAEVGTSNFINLPRWYMQGENGTAIINDWQLNGKITMVSDWEKRDAVPVVTAAGLTKTMAPRTDETIQDYPLPEVTSDVRDFYRGVIAAVRGEKECPIQQDQLRRLMKLCDTIFQSGETGEAIHTEI